jgi:hypothetical protein
LRVVTVAFYGYVGGMRSMLIRPFPGSKIQFTDLEFLIKTRLTNDLVLWPGQAVALVGYMAWPNDPVMREHWSTVHQRNDPSAISELTKRLKLTQQHWVSVADIVHAHYDLAKGGHQERRGEPSIGKAIYLVAQNAKARGTGTAKLWEIWTTYKDVAHLVTAAGLVAYDAQIRHRTGPYGLKLHQLQPYRMAMLLPELVISVAMSIEDYGLNQVAHGQTEPTPNHCGASPPTSTLPPFHRRSAR